MKKNVNKRGFNLIEIAIVLAVIGLVIGGIYVAASSVTENQRKQKAQSQLLTIVQNMRAVYANQIWTTTAPTAPVLYNARVMPADVVPDSTTNPATFTGAFGAVSITAPDANNFGVSLAGLPKGACIDLITKNFGTAQQTDQIGLTNITNGTNAVGTPYTPATANTACAAATNNTLIFNFLVHV